MSLLAAITVIQCDQCRRVECMRTDIEYSTVEATWYEGIRYHFCPLCRELAVSQDRIAEDNHLRENIRLIAARHDRKGTQKQEVAEYVH
jgi:hypothetical protein